MNDHPTRRATLKGLVASAAALALPDLRAWPAARAAPPRPVPSREQLVWQREELAMFLHFGVNTFTDREWGDGKEDPVIFAPARLDARQWTRAARAAGFRAMVLTAKHHDGFCLWPTQTTAHAVSHSPFRDGHGDVVREFVDACRADGLKPGLYLSPWDRHEPSYGDTPRYNDFYCDQLTELLTHYGPIHEVWFDGANGEGPNGKKQTYDWSRVWRLVRTLQPHAVMFSDAGPDIRWMGNERGIAGDPNWSTVDPAAVPVPGMGGRAVIDMLQHGDPAGRAWRPGEADVSIRPGWFHHAAEDSHVKTVDQLVELYFTSVGRNAKLLLNVPPTRAGVLHDVDVARVASMHERLTKLFSQNLANRRRAIWRPVAEREIAGELDLGRSVQVGLIDLREPIERGQTIARYVVEGAEQGDWRELCRGTTIGCRRLDRVAGPPIRRIRVHLEGVDIAPPPVSVGVY